jgi:hypothetical protein
MAPRRASLRGALHFRIQRTLLLLAAAVAAFAIAVFAVGALAVLAIGAAAAFLAVALFSTAAGRLGGVGCCGRNGSDA